MSDRQYRGARGGAGGSYRGGPRGGPRGGRGGNAQGGHHERSSHNDQSKERERPKKENILDLSKYLDKGVTVKFSGGREVTGILKGYDALMNLVLDEGQEAVRDEEGNEATRPLGLVVVRGTLLVLISPVDGSEEIANPFAQEDDDD